MLRPNIMVNVNSLSQKENSWWCGANFMWVT